MTERARPLLGTLVAIRADGCGAQLAQRAISAAFEQVALVHRLMSFHDHGSDVSRINAADTGCHVCIDPRTYRVLQFARRLGDLSAGMFDIATAATLVRAGLLPQRQHAQQCCGTATYRDLELSRDHRVRWRRKGCIDLGGIAKGYAIDCAIEALQAHGVASGMVNAGGDLRCFGEAQLIHVRRPDAPAALIRLGWLSNRALATSGGYWSETLVDPRQRACTTWDASISVVAGNCMSADALTKLVRLAPPQLPAILARLKARAVVIDCTTARMRGAA